MNYEKLAVDAVTDAIAITDFFDPYVTENDKGPSWDGKFTVYSKPGNVHKKSDWLGEVPVQVKSVQSTDLSKSEVKYPVEISDLRNYLKIGGTMYFVVFITPLAMKKIYYCSFLPFDLQRILKSTNVDQKTKNLSFKEFPTNKNDITNVIFDCLRDIDKQSLLKSRDYGMDDAAKEFDISKLHYSMTISSIGCSREKIPESMLNRDIFFYAHSDSGSISFPIEHIPAVKMVVEELSKTVGAGEVDFYDRYQLIHKIDGKELKFGKSFSAIIADETVKFKYKLSGNLQERILDLSFVINLLESRVLRIGGASIPLGVNEQEIEGFDIENMKSQYQFFNKVNVMLKNLGVEKPLDVDQITDKDHEYIKVLLRAFDNGEIIKFKEDNIPTIVPLKIANIKLVLVFKPVGEREYEILDFFKTKLDIVSQNEYDERDVFATSQYTILDKECFINYDNINYDKMLEDFKRFEGEGHYNRVNVLGLDLIMAYEETKIEKYLKFAKKIFQWLYETDKNGAPFYLMNLYQCNIRTGELTEEEKSKIYEMITDYKDNPKFLGGLYCLLKEKGQVQKMLMNMSECEAKEFVTYPIYKLLEG